MEFVVSKVLPLVQAALKEDLGKGDITTKLAVPSKAESKAAIVAKQKGIACGLEAAHLAFRDVDKNIEFTHFVRDGQDVAREQIMAVVEGKARSILRAERVALNFISHLSGIATLTSKYVEKVKPHNVEILDTRKTLPGLRYLEKYAVNCGGGTNHRFGLWDQVLIKDNHLLFHSLKQLIKKVKKQKPKKMLLEVEVKNLKQLEEALQAKPDIIMLDNFSLNKIKQAVNMRNKIRNSKFEIRTQLEVSGGVSLANAARIAATGVERISVGALTHSAKALDVALDCA